VDTASSDEKVNTVALILNLGAILPWVYVDASVHTTKMSTVVLLSTLYRLCLLGMPIQKYGLQ
jgi:hypothetical protein